MSIMDKEHFKVLFYNVFYFQDAKIKPPYPLLTFKN